MRAYLRLDPNLPDQKADYPDGAYRAFMDTLCHAEQQPKRGRFRNRKLLAVLLDKRARWISYLLEHGDLVELASGALYVDGWDEWQEGDHTVPERMRRLRSRRRDVTPTDTPPVTPRVTTPVTVGDVDTPSSGSGGGGISRSGGGAPLSNGGAKTFMGYQPRASIEDIQRQEQEDWTAKCGNCGVLKRKHPTGGDHPFLAVREVSA